jgi:hypothetical protein
MQGKTNAHLVRTSSVGGFTGDGARKRGLAEATGVGEPTSSDGDASL